MEEDIKPVSDTGRIDWIVSAAVAGLSIAIKLLNSRPDEHIDKLPLLLLASCLFVIGKYFTGSIRNFINLRSKAIISRQDLNQYKAMTATRLNEFEFRLKEVLNKIIIYHSLYTEKQCLEMLLQTIQDNRTEARWSMARMLSYSLDNYFCHNDKVIIPNQNYYNYSKAFDTCIGFCENITLTCIYDPSNWFKVIQRCGASDCWARLDDFDKIFSGVDTRGFESYSDNGEPSRYPKHYISFINVPNATRIFLLNVEKWKNMKANERAFRKFIIPCKHHKVKTIFVLTDIFTQSTMVRDNLGNSVLAELDQTDINLFDSSACMIWQENTLDFLFYGSNLQHYCDLVNFIDNKAEQECHSDLGIYKINNESTYNEIKDVLWRVKLPVDTSSADTKNPKS